MIYTTLSQLKTRHKEIMSSYKNTIPFYKRSTFFCLLRIVAFFAWCLIWFESGNRYLKIDYVYYDMSDMRLLFIPMLLSIIGFFIFKPYKIWTDRTYFGKIEKIEKQSAELIKKDEKGKKDEKDNYKRFSYNTRLGIWMAEGEGERRDVIRIGDSVYYIGDSELMQVGEGGNEGIEWLLQYAPIYETVEGKKTHSRMLIRAEIPRGSYMKIEMRCDGGSWMDVGRIVGRCAGVVPIRIPVNRCDRFELKLSGRGKFTLQSMLREFHVGSER